MRSRNLKAGTYGNPILNRLPADHRWLFLGLGCIADRRGLVEDRPRKIADTIMRGLDTDVNEALDVLATFADDDGSTLISRYVGANGVKVIKINKFLRHNSPHRDEPENPNLCDSDGTTGKAQCKHGTRTVHARDMHEGSTLLTADCLTAGLLTPDCGLLTEDCPPTEGGGARSDRASPAPVVIPVREGDEPIQQSEIDTWQALYGNVNVLDTLKRMAGHWAATDRSSRKTRKGIRKSINTWLARDHDSARGHGRGTPMAGIDGRAERTRQAGDRVLAEIREGKLGKRN